MSARKPPLNGKHASPPPGRPSADEPAGVDPRLLKLLAAVYGSYQKLDDKALNAACRHDFVFHMTDWAADLAQLAELYAHPENFTREQAGEVVSGFLYHGLSHLRAAARLLLDWQPEDIFKAIDGQPAK